MSWITVNATVPKTPSNGLWAVSLVCRSKCTKLERDYFHAQNQTQHEKSRKKLQAGKLKLTLTSYKITFKQNSLFEICLIGHLCLLQTSQVKDSFPEWWQPYAVNVEVTTSVYPKVDDWQHNKFFILHLNQFHTSTSQRYPVVSIQSRFDTSRFDTNRSRFDTHVMSFRYTSKVDSIHTEVNSIQPLFT